MEHTSPKLNYVLDHIFGQYFEQDCLRYTDYSEFMAYEGPKIVYGSDPQHLTLPYSNFIFKGYDSNLSPEKGISIKDQSIFKITNSEKSLFDFDVLGCIFYLLSRYEEYLPSTRDDHGRYLSTNSILSKEDLLDPPIDRWLMLLKQKIELAFPGFKLSYKSSYEVIPTMDIDHYYDLKYKPWYLKAAKCINSLKKRNLEEFKLRAKSILGAHDIFDQYDRYQSLFKNHRKLYFLHLGKASVYDESSPINQQAKIEVIEKIKSKQTTIGIHPSYLSNSDTTALHEEFISYTILTGQKARVSRQHFLKLSFPESYRMLIDHGIEEDYTLAYADHIGFRAGTAHPFYWYDLEKDHTTQLLVHPNGLMDVSLQQYMGLSVKEAQAYVDRLKSSCKKYSAPLVFIWHNTTMSDQGVWKNWNQVLRRLAAEK